MVQPHREGLRRVGLYNLELRSFYLEMGYLFVRGNDGWRIDDITGAVDDDR